MSEPSARLLHEFTYRAVIGSPHEVGVGPLGHRQFYEVTSGSIEGERLRGKLIGPAGDWMLVGTDGFMRMDVRAQIATDDGAIICAHYFGPAETNAATAAALAAERPTDFADQSNRSHWMLETGDPRYSWVNQSVLVGEGRLCPAGPGAIGFEHRVYRVA